MLAAAAGLFDIGLKRKNPPEAGLHSSLGPSPHESGERWLG
ncbi:hypothetical protein BQ8794_20009 [Mesorhizobium prunaredense]|uniref:Uncharacterized protein n=1 Tax=Mesorhizobium prunaredense TaxID=1631249 RepID=A0A1R3V4W3_9HYPH|nr:hypothetical protein BQ8794_20009 [Mesorhizobium prunaredense]